MGKRKNVLLLLSDQQRLDTISAYGMDCIAGRRTLTGLLRKG